MTDSPIQTKIDRILDRIKDSGSGLSLAQLGLVKKVRVSADKKKLILFLKGMSGSKTCCAIMNFTVLEDLESRMKQEFQREFPGFEIFLANA